MLCNCRNCKHAQPTEEGLVCYKKLNFTHPHDGCDEFDSDEVVTVWNNPLTWISIATLAVVTIVNIIL